MIEEFFRNKHRWPRFRSIESASAFLVVVAGNGVWGGGQLVVADNWVRGGGKTIVAVFWGLGWWAID